ncbi:bifunctional UDP-sugar hydrolase/5'-nucleotidase [Synechococcus sp. CS-1328]|uniref:bifunctional metallophosphatase/5'-nucleotidase n=1 Tax=Synechococcus sp. CS-1328 TaxID=2847976 RepID=UPI00223B34E4|nr:bifunctional metallophosphatase/5'-nucleotidase [Synechococcus sp. CS-1328]MCT0225162.1 bifunctional metallophosphatase/5'-nucleotidase [Synechococcus sp. CS-1328]
MLTNPPLDAGKIRPSHPWRSGAGLRAVGGLLAMGALLLAVFAPAMARAERIELQLVQLNDVYEITPIPGGGGDLAQVAGLVRQLRARNPRTLVLLAGDFLSPSAVGTAVVEGRRLDGRQMVAVLNALGLDQATFGNHEFDLAEGPFRDRLREARFGWISSNVNDTAGRSFPGVVRQRLIELRGSGGASLRLGLLGVTLPSNPAAYVRYSDAVASATSQAQGLRQQGADVVVALTHQALAQDQQLASSAAPIDLILGGHEHENLLQLRFRNPAVQGSAAELTAAGGPAAAPALPPPGCRPAGVPIAKADANARTVWLHTLAYVTVSRCLEIESSLLPVDGRWPSDPAVARQADHWLQKAEAAFRRQGLEPERVIGISGVLLDGRDGPVRSGSTTLTRLITAAMRAADPASAAALLNAGAIRLDDVLPPGPIREMEVIRALPFGGGLSRVDLDGGLLQRVLEVGVTNRGSGGYLQVDGAALGVDGRWWLDGEPLDPGRRYRVVLPDFLLTGQEVNLGFLRQGAAGVEVIGPAGDLRQAVIRWLREHPPGADQSGADQLGVDRSGANQPGAG